MPSEVGIVSPSTHSHAIHSTLCSQIDNTLPILAATTAEPIQSLTMENIPLQSITLEDSRAHDSEQPIDLHFPPTLNHLQNWLSYNI